MKKIVFLIIACAITVAVNAQKADSTIVFNKLVHDFGSITKSEGPQSYTFEFTNTGNKPVSVLKVTASCGCTTPGWTKEPVAPGGKGDIKATYNPTDRKSVV